MVRKAKCMFCNDHDLAVKHLLEDEALVRIAHAATALLAQRKTTAALSGAWQELSDALLAFNNVESSDAALKVAIKKLRVIEADLS